MERHGIWNRVVLFLAVGLWVFLLVSLASFHTDDWPSHQVYPYAPVQNLCGPVGSLIAYHLFRVVGQGVFPILFFSGVCLALYAFRSRVSDLWLRAVGLLVLSVAFAAILHSFKAGSPDGFPEGHGGVLGIAASAFLQTHFNTVGARLILAISFFVGLLLAADDLVLRTPALVGSALSNVKSKAPGVSRIKWNFPSLPKLPALSRFITLDMLRSKMQERRERAAERKEQKAAAAEAKPVEQAAPTAKGRIRSDDEEAPLKPPVILKLHETEEPSVAVEQAASSAVSSGPETIELTYELDHEPAPAAVEKAFTDESDPAPAAEAVIPPPEQQAVTIPPQVQIKKDIIVRLPNTIRPRQVAPPPAPPKELGEYQLPGWDILGDAEHGFAEQQEKFVREKAAVLEQALREFGIEAQVVEIDTGPVITMYEISMAAGTKVSQITALSNDIARALAATNVRIVAPVPGKSTVGIEVPNAQKEKVRLKELMQLAPAAQQQKMQIPLFLGKDASGEALVTDLAAMPHCLIAGTTGSGKSVCINSIIMSIMYTQRPDMVKLILFDPKVVEMAPFKEIPHLMCPVINESGRATSVLDWACEKMDERYEVLAEAGVRNIAGYNKLTKEELFERFKPSTPEEEAKVPKHLPYIVIIIDELADLMMTSGKEVESYIVRLAQKARAVGIHLIVATQRPQATVVTGLIKANMPCKIAFRVASKMDSRIVLDQNGADLLLGQGDMLFLPPGAGKPMRAQGTFIDDKEIRESVKLVAGLAEAQYEPELVQIKSVLNADGEMEKDDLFDDAVRVVLETKRGSVSLLQRRLTIGYSRASRLIEQMAQCGILGEYKGSQAREVTMTLEDWDAMKAQEQADQESGMTV